MKKIILPFLLFAFTQCYTQQNEAAEKKAITENVNQFFKILETKDTVLYNTLVYPNAQIWTIRPQQGASKIAMRSFSDDMISLVATKPEIEEKPMSYEVKVHNNIAIVWVPYTLNLSGKFSHCGVDVFTLLKAPEGWKIVSSVYSVESGGCASLQKL